MTLLVVELAFSPQEQDTAIRQRGGERTPPQAAPEGTPTTQQPPPGPAPAQDPWSGCMSSAPILVAFLLIFYFMAIRPQQKQEKARKELLSKLTRGDRVVTNSGIHGVVAGLADDTVQLRIDAEGKVKITVDRAAIGRVLSDDAAAKAAAAAKDVAKE